MAGNGDRDGPVPLIGVGASAGGVEALTELVKRLPEDLPAAVFVVLHVSPAGTSVLDRILDRAGPLEVRMPADGEPIRPGVVYVAPPDRHLTIDDGVVALTAGPRENGHRPSVDVLFRSLATAGAASTGVILSGTRDDGTRGLTRIKASGGTALLQDPGEALYPGMIRSAAQSVAVDGILPIAGLAAELAIAGRDSAQG
jgi:two-component system chemotaxis response regulator CheB